MELEGDLIMAKFIPLMEAASQVNQKKYKCPYCDNRYIRTQLADHIQKTHEDLIPEGYTALRVAFNTINKKTEGHCIICREVTAWNENKGRYERLCGRQSCTDAYKKQVRERIKVIYGTDCILKDPRYAEEQQKKMLANRKISGKYKFRDGGLVDYVGSYEKKLLQFMDSPLMNIESIDIASPGPVIHYMYKGEEHMYISDFLYVPYNLIIEVKDGGSNPNGRPMEEYREKQLAKEKAIIDDKKYNYLRLTNNDFSQLLEIMAVLKYTFMENPEQIVVRVNESEMDETIKAALAPCPTPDCCNKDNYYMIKHLKDDGPSVYSITKDPTQNTFVTVSPKGNKISNMTKDQMPGSYITFKLKDWDKAEEVYQEAIAMLGQEIDDTEYFYKQYTGRNVLTEDQILFDDTMQFVPNFSNTTDALCESIEKYITEGVYGC